MVKTFLIIAIFLPLISGCHTNRQVVSDQEFLPSVFFNDKDLSSAIYDYDPWDSDVRAGEFLIRLSEIHQAEGELKIEGIVLAKDSREALIGAVVTVTDSQQNTLKTVSTDSTGNFSVTSDFETGNLLEFRFIGFRTVWIDISKLIAQSKN